MQARRRTPAGDAFDRDDAEADGYAQLFLDVDGGSRTNILDERDATYRGSRADWRGDRDPLRGFVFAMPPYALFGRALRGNTTAAPLTAAPSVSLSHNQGR